MSETIRARSAALQKFTGGLNNYWDQSAIDNTELAAIINFEFATNGSLQSRPPIYQQKNGSGTNIVTPVTGQPVDIIGTYIRQDGERYLVCTTNTKTWIYNVATYAWTEITTFKASDCTQYLNKIVLTSTTEGEGGYWEGGTFTNTPTMPALSGIELLQTRFFGYGVKGTTTANIIFWSNIAATDLDGVSTDVWNWKNQLPIPNYNGMYVEIGGGDGQWITAMEQGYNEIIIFRNASTYKFSFGSDPGTTGIMQPMQQNIGAENKHSVVKFENAHFVFSNGILYKYQSSLFYPLNAQKVKFEQYSFSRRIEHAVSIVGRRCLVWSSGSLYAYNLDTETWSEWASDHKVAYFMPVARKTEQVEETLYFGISGATAAPTGGYALYRIEDKPFSLVGSETFKCYMKTKIYDFDTPVEWKRLYFWTADITSAKNIKASVYPVDIPATTLQATWDELSKDYPEETGYSTWDDLSFDEVGDETFGTWDTLKQTDGQISTIVEITASKPIRVEVKLNHALRFRRAYFELYLDCDGTASTSPVNVFNIIPMIGAKAKISKAAN